MGSVLVDQSVPYSCIVSAGHLFSSCQQASAVRPLGIDLAAAAVLELPGDPPADPRHRLIRELDQTEMIDH